MRLIDRYIAAIVCALLLAGRMACAQQMIDLSGVWQLSLGDSLHYSEYVMLPGSLLTNDKGDDVTAETQWTSSLYDSSYYFNPAMEAYRQKGNVKFPFFLTPRKHYVGAAWYRRSVYVPRQWKHERIVLHLERPHIETTIYVNGKEVGHQMSLSAPHEYDLTRYIRTGKKNDIVICVYNGIENVGVGQDSHSVTDQTQGNWNGIIGNIELQARPAKLNIKNVKVYPDVKNHQARVVVELENHVKGLRLLPRVDYFVSVEAQTINSPKPHRVRARIKEALKSRMEFTLNMGNGMQTWDEFSPNVYRLTVEAGYDTYETTFGMREIDIQGTQLLMNGHPIFLRGTVENCCFPLTGYPPTDVDSWMRIFRQCREYGINHVRFHSYCPPEAAFVAADQMGIYLQPEGPSWPNHGVKLGVGQSIDKYLMEETQRMVEAYGNHPSFCMLAAGNEPAGRWVEWGREFVKYWRKTDPRRIYCTASVGGGWEWDDGSEYHVKGGARGLDWSRHAPQSMDDYSADIAVPRNFHPTDEHPQNTEPYISHEQGQWCAFPDFREIGQYDGAYRAGNFEIFRDLLQKNGMASQAEKFLMASGRLQTLAYKFEIERNLRTPGYAGFQLLGLNDYSGQGTALVGVLNTFWHEKGYCDAWQWREFCAPTVLMARFPKFVFTRDEQVSLPIEMYNAYRGEFKPLETSYTVEDAKGNTIASGKLSARNVPLGKCHSLGVIDLNLITLAAPAKYTLRLQAADVIRNHYDFWVYEPASEPLAKSNVFETDTLNDEALAVLRRGGNVLLTAAGRVTLGSDVRQNYLPVFWNTSWFKMKPPHTTGCAIDTQHPLFRHGFPTDDWGNLNWWELLNRAQVMNLRELPADYQPPIQPIDTWHVSRKLGMMIEAQVLGGRLLMTTMDIKNDLKNRHVARQMRAAILDYMQSADFQPALVLTPETIRHFYTEQAPPVDMYTNQSPDELKPKFANKE